MCHPTFSMFLSRHLKGPIQKLAVNAGLTCPNRDGLVGRGGCSYCNNTTFSPKYCNANLSIKEQIKRGMVFFSHKVKSHTGYLAYFQSYSNTYAPLSHLQDLYEEALSVPNVVGLVIATRPDCISTEILDYLAFLNKRYFIHLELGVESTYDDVLQDINRGHDYACVQRAVCLIKSYGLTVGIHLILGLPGVSFEQDVAQADHLNDLGIDVLKLHQLQIVRGTRMAQIYKTHPEKFVLLTADDYARLVACFLQHLDSSVALDRFVSESPAELLIAPRWGVKPQAVEMLVKKYLNKLC